MLMCEIRTADFIRLPRELRSSSSPIVNMKRINPILARKNKRGSELSGKRKPCNSGNTALSSDGPRQIPAMIEIEQFAGSRVDPMRVLKDHHHGLLTRETFELSKQRLQCLLLFALG